MLAAYVGRLDGADPLDNLAVGERPDPELRPGWSIVRVEAAALNRHDLFTLRGRSSRPVVEGQILGCDAAGVVEAHGGEVPAGTPAPGEPVVVHAVIGCRTCPTCLGGDELLCPDMALLSEGEFQGTLAQRLPVPTSNLLPRPATLGAVEAACLPTAYLTAYRMLFTRAGLQPGQSVLVQGASGGVATAAILIARAAEITALATSRDEEKRALAVELGAVAAVAPDREAAETIRELTGGRGVDAVIETVGEPTWELSLRAVRPGGSVVVAGATAGDSPPARLRRIFWFQLSILGSTMGTRLELERVVTLAGSGAVRPLVDVALPLERAAEAFARLAAGEQRGKVVLVPWAGA